MSSNIYAKPYTEVLTVLKCLDNKEYSRIPKKEIEFLQENCDRDYKFMLDKNKSLAEQNISREANAVLVILFQKYFADENQKERLKIILMDNYNKDEAKKKESYSSNDIFKKKEKQFQETQMIEYKENIIVRCINTIKSFWKKLLNK